MLARNTPYSRLTHVVNAISPVGRSTGNGRATDSLSWTPAGIAVDVAKQETYLEQVIATSALQAVGLEALRQLALQPDQRVLEAGCGTGLFLASLAERVGATGQVVGVDLSPEFVDLARQRAAALGERVTVERADIRRLPFPDASFDAAHCERVLMHLADPVAALTELRRVLKPGGVMVAAETDWLGCRFDHPDQELITLLVRRAAASIAQPDMGLTLVRRFMAAGYRAIEVRPMIGGVRELALMTLYGLDLARAADELVADGVVTRARADAGLAWLTEADRVGTYFACGGMIVASGRA
jgi:ubiquinone/menaquinone biosynthesis C-methylase UbiE